MAAGELETTIDDEAAREVWPQLSWDSSAGATPLGMGWDSEPTVVDWFGDGEPALLVTAGGGALGRTARVYRPLAGSSDFPRRYDAGTRVEALDGLRCVCSIPNGLTSRFDLVALGGEGLVWLRNEGDANQPEFGARQPLGIAADLGIGPCRVVQLVAVDWDGDGRTDLLAGVDDLHGYWPDSDTVPVPQQVGFNQLGGHPSYDRGGSWRGRAPRGRLFWLRNVEGDEGPAFELQPEITAESGPLDLGVRPAPLMISWGGGGGLELLVTDARGQVRIHRNFGGQRPPVLMEARTLRSGGAPLLLPDDRTVVIAADIDGDLRAELLYGTSDGRIFAVHAGANRLEATPPTAILHESPTPWLGGHAVVTTGDLHADGGLDLVVGDAPGRLHLLRDLGKGDGHRYARPVELEAGGAAFRLDPGLDGLLDGPMVPRLGFACPTLADWTGNGRLDLLVGGAGGEIVFLRNDGSVNSPRFAVPLALRLNGAPMIVPPRVRPASADWFGTGRLDLIALDLQGWLCVYPRVGNLELGSPVPLVDRLGRFLRLDGGFGLAGRCAIWAGRWSGSDAIDLLIGLPRGNRHVIPALTGHPLENLDDLSTVLLLENQGGGVLIPRPLRHADGRPLIFGAEGCVPCGVGGTDGGSLDLLIGGDDGQVCLIRREALLW